jgi:hypothetical protein
MKSTPALLQLLPSTPYTRTEVSAGPSLFPNAVLKKPNHNISHAIPTTSGGQKHTQNRPDVPPKDIPPPSTTTISNKRQTFKHNEDPHKDQTKGQDAHANAATPPNGLFLAFLNTRVIACGGGDGALRVRGADARVGHTAWVLRLEVDIVRPVAGHPGHLGGGDLE